MSIIRDDGPGEALLPEHDRDSSNGPENGELVTRVWIETKKLWRIAGPAIVNRVASYSMNIITLAFSGHLGDVQLAAISIANNVIVGFSFGLLVCSLIVFKILYNRYYFSIMLLNVLYQCFVIS